MKSSRVPWLTLIVVVLASGVVMAGGWQYSGVGARAKAMGGAYRGLSHDGHGAYYNPGGLAFLERNLLEVNAEFSGPRPEVTPNFQQGGFGFGYLDGQTRYPNKDNIYAMGIVSLFLRPSAQGRLVLGGAVYQAFDHNNVMNLFHLSPAYNAARTMAPDNHRSNLDVVTMQPTLAYKVNDKLGVGVGVQIHRGDVWIDQVRLLDNPYPYPASIRPYDKIPGSTSIDGYGFGVGANVGVQYKAGEKLTLGANFASGAKMTIDGESIERVYFPKNLGIASLYNDPLANQIPEQRDIYTTYRDGLEWKVASNFEMEMKLPAEFGLGFAYQANERTIIAADFAYMMWSQFDDWKIEISERKLFESNNPNASASWIGLLQDVTYPFDWDNSFRLSLGMQRTMNEKWVGRVGYMYDDTPIPDETFNSLVIDPAASHHFNLGATFKLTQFVWFDGAFEAILGGSREISELTDQNSDGYWDNFGGEWKRNSFNSTWALTYRF